MNSVDPQVLSKDASLSDSEVIDQVLGGDIDQFEIIMRRFNRRVYRVARSILGDEQEVEDVMQSAYIKVFRNLGQFAGRAQFSTWLMRIVIHEALNYRKRKSNGRATVTGNGELMAAVVCEQSGPLRQITDKDLAVKINAAIDLLPVLYRVVFIMRAVEGISTADTARTLKVSQDVVKSRLYRAKAQLRHVLKPVVSLPPDEIYPFHLRRCDRVVKGVMPFISHDLMHHV